MMTRKLLVRCAPLAIAASVALPAIPAAAQDATAAQPVIVLPEPAPATAPATAPAPTIVLPETTPPVVAEQAAPAEAAPVTAREPATRPAVARNAPRQTATRRPAAASIVDRTAPAVAEPVAPLPATVSEPVEPIAAAPLAAEPAAATNDATGEIALAALLGALGLGVVGGVAYAAARRRRRRAFEAEHHEPLGEVIAEPAIVPEPVAARSVEPMAAPRFTAPAPAAAAFATPVVATATTKRTPLRANGDPIALPAEMPETFEERDALLKELVAAEPDRANPFTGVRARARRAKLIMQSLNRDFTTRKPRIDLSEYTNRWPALRGWQPATA